MSKPKAKKGKCTHKKRVSCACCGTDIVCDHPMFRNDFHDTLCCKENCGIIKREMKYDNE